MTESAGWWWNVVRCDVMVLGETLIFPHQISLGEKKLLLFSKRELYYSKHFCFLFFFLYCSFFFIYLINLFIFGCVGTSLLHVGFL